MPGTLGLLLNSRGSSLMITLGGLGDSSRGEAGIIKKFCKMLDDDTSRGKEE